MAQFRFRELFGGLRIYAGPKAKRLLEDMLVYSDAVYIDNNLHLYHSHLNAFDLWWNIVTWIRACYWMDNTQHWCCSNTVMDADCDVKESKIAIYTGITSKRKSHYKHVKNFMKKT